MKQRWLAWTILILGMILCRIAFTENVVYNIDEAEYATAARGLDHGLLSGVDFLGSNKTPGIVFLYNALFHIFGETFTATRIAYIVMLIVEGGLLVELAMSLWGGAAAVPAAVLFWMVANSFDIPPDMVPLNTEGAAMVFVVLALWLAWSRPRDLRALFCAGIAFGVSVFFRQSALFFAIPLVTAVMLTPGGRVRRAVLAAIGSLVLWIPVLALYAAHHGLGWAWDSWVRYPLEYAGDTGIGGFAARFAYMTGEFIFQLFVPVALAVFGAALLARNGVASRITFIASLFGGSVLALCTGSRFFGHYWVQMFPLVALLGASAWVHLSQGQWKARTVLTVGVIIASLVAALHFNTWRSWDKYATPRGVSFFQLGENSGEKKIAEFVRENSQPDETICVWGYCPQIYWYSNRQPGVRDFICHYVCGYSPGVSNLLPEPSARRLGHPRAISMFIDDLERSKAKFIFDLSTVRTYTFSFLNYPISAYPDVANYIRRNYIPDGRIDDALIYRRRTPADTWLPDDNAE